MAIAVTRNLKGISRFMHIVYPLTVDDVFLWYESFLTEFEVKEIKSYKTIFYLGERSLSKSNKAMGMPGPSEAPVYYDKYGNYVAEIGGHVHYRYEIMSYIGKGRYSNVIKAFDHKDQITVAIKIYRTTTCSFSCYVRECAILKAINEFGGSEGVVQYLESFFFRTFNCIVFELLSCDLKGLTLFRPEGIPASDIAKIVRGICVTLDFLHKHDIIHMDLIPSNIGFRWNAQDVVLLDFGISVFPENGVRLTLLPTLGYQSPEVIFEGPISPAVDMWAVGCLIVELFSGQLLFRDKNNYDQIASIMELLGVPSMTLVDYCTFENLRRYFDITMQPRYCQATYNGSKWSYSAKMTEEYSTGIGIPGSRSLDEIFFQPADSSILRFVTSCLTWNPKNRITATEALKHEFLNNSPVTNDVCSLENPGGTSKGHIETLCWHHQFYPYTVYAPTELNFDLKTLFSSKVLFPYLK